MKWIQLLLDNIWAVIIIGGVLLQLFQAITRKKGADESALGQPEQSKEFEFEDPELAERTRKIREEIQRKIAQRQRGGTAQETATVPEYAEEGSDTPPPLVREVIVSSPQPTPQLRSGSRIDAQRQAEILEQQAAWQEKLIEAKRMKESASKRTEFEEATADHSAAKRAATRSTVVGDLRSPEALRRAFILREVLGPPVALRK
ncbi:hypothetical protein ESB00_15915 [Oleiharenicola lentus]|uniref:Uncharacterized protein n=1 Tax=Oleiharenicola lentus TaxID=2508720 RepID=A0A4Q1C4I0_9BACT|nr:hypothetical protein ESB00_15915 [Oleiharenicola lentus]